MQLLNLTNQQLRNVGTYAEYFSIDGSELTIIVNSSKLTNFNPLAIFSGNISSNCHTTNYYLDLVTKTPKKFESTYLLHTIENLGKKLTIYHIGIGFVTEGSGSDSWFPPPYSKPWPTIDDKTNLEMCSTDFSFNSFNVLKNITKYTDEDWIQLIEDASNTCANVSQYDISCNMKDGYKNYKFSPGIYYFSQQIWLPPNTVIEGANDPNVAGKPRSLSGNLNDHTIFYANSYNKPFSCTPTQKTDWAIKSIWSMGGMKCTRQGFLMNTNTILRNCIGQGYQNEQEDYGMGLNGGAFIELPGCACAHIDLSDGNNICGGPDEMLDGKYIKDLSIASSFWTGKTGDAVNNVLVENLRVNIFGSDDTKVNNTLFWSSMNINDNAHNNIYLRKIISMNTLADGINVHGNIQNFIGEDLHLENAKDDIVAIWGVGGGTDALSDSGTKVCPKLTNTVASNISFNRIFAKPSSGAQRVGDCYRVIGAKDVSFNNVTCCANDFLGIIDTYCAKFPPTTAKIDVSGVRYYHANKKICKEPDAIYINITNKNPHSNGNFSTSCKPSIGYCNTCTLTNNNLPPAPSPTDCIKLWGNCTKSQNNCCPNSKCIGNSDYRQCLPDNSQ